MPWHGRNGRAVGAAFVLHAALVGTWAGRVPAIKHALGLSDTALGAALFGMAAGTLVGSWWGGRLARRWQPATGGGARLPGVAGVLGAPGVPPPPPPPPAPLPGFRAPGGGRGRGRETPPPVGRGRPPGAAAL